MTRSLNRAFGFLIGLAVISPSMAAAPACSAPPLSLDDGDAAFSRAFAEGTENLTRVRATFAWAYSSACEKGWLKEKSLPPIVLLNAPNANIASIYRDEAGRTVLEYPFVTGDGSNYYPSEEAIEEAIYCAVVGATEAEQEESGRCLPD